MEKNNLYDGLPMGLGMALTANAQAMERFSSLSPEQRQRLIDDARAMRSKQEMQSYVAQLAAGGLL